MLSKSIYRVKFNGELEKIDSIQDLSLGDQLEIHLDLVVPFWLEFVHLKDQHPSGCEPQQVFSRYNWKHGVGCYQAVKDISTNFFMSYLRKGKYRFKYRLYVNNQGQFQSGITSLQSMYAPELTKYGESRIIRVGKN